MITYLNCFFKDLNLKPYIFDHALIHAHLTKLRDKSTSSEEFRQKTKIISILMGSKLLEEIKLVKYPVKTPLSTFKGSKIAHPAPIFVSILRAGSIMVESFLELCPEASVGHIGIYRDHSTLEPVEYFNNLDADLSDREVILCDPMLATGGSAVYAVSLLKKKNAQNIRFACLLAANQGIQNLLGNYPDVSIYAAALDQELDQNGYIVPGLGDAGDRIYDTTRKN